MTSLDRERDDRLPLRLSYEEPRDEPSASPASDAASTQLLTGLVVLLIAVLGAPQVWAAVRGDGVGPALVFYPVLGIAFGYLAVRGRGQ